MRLNDLVAPYLSLPADQRKELEADAKAATADMIWVCNPGPQTDAYLSEADELFYGGAAGGGKSDLLIGVALNTAHNARIFRRNFKDIDGTGGLAQRLAQIRGTWAGYHKQNHVVRLGKGREIEFAAFENAAEAEDYQGRPADFYGYDEITQFEEVLFRFLMTWNRSTKDGQRTRVICTGNPPVTAEGRWVIKYWGPWLDETHPLYPTPPGVLRWVTTINGEDVWLDGPDLVEVDGEMIKPRSRTFIPAALEDNPDLHERDDYRSNLAALPEPYRSALKQGKFNAGTQDHDWQVIPTEWVLAAFARYNVRSLNSKFVLGPMTAMGVDVAQGGSANTVLAPLHNTTFTELIRKKGVDTKNGAAVAALVIENLTDGALVNIDCGGGWGNSAYEHLDNNGIDVQACIGARSVSQRDRSGKFTFKNERALAYWSLREALDPRNGDDVAIFPDPQVLADLTAVRRKKSEESTVIQIEDKAEIIKRLGRSTDDGDAIANAWLKASHEHKRDRKSRERKRNPGRNRSPQVQVGYASAKAKYRKGR